MTMERKNFFSLDDLNRIDCFRIKKIEDIFCWVETLTDGTQNVIAKGKNITQLYIILYENFGEKFIKKFNETFFQTNHCAYINIENITDFRYEIDLEKRKLINVVADFKSGNSVNIYKIKKSQLQDEKARNSQILDTLDSCADIRNFYC